MTLPRQVMAGHGILPRIAEMARDLGLKGTALVITGEKTRRIAGVPVHDYLRDSGYDVHIHLCETATKVSVEKAFQVAEELKASFTLGVGGGSKIDVAKLVAARLYKPFISVPTAASHDGISSPRASLKDGDTPLSAEAVVPLGILADTEIISKAPYRSLAAGCADVISNSTAILDWQLAARLKGEEFSTTAFTLSKMCAEVIIENAPLIHPGSEESAWIAIKPMISSGISISVAGTSRPASGSEHLFSHALDIIAPGKALHGEQCGLGTIMVMYLYGGDWHRIRNALQKIGAPVIAGECGLTRDEVIQALVKAHSLRPERYTILGERGLAAEAAERLATVTGVI